jgi:hypothetical protein
MLSTGARRDPRGHHDHAEDRYWITSSAVANSVSGTSMPSALAAVSLMTNSNLVDCTTGGSAGFGALEDAAGIDADLAKQLRQTHVTDRSRAADDTQPGWRVAPDD